MQMERGFRFMLYLAVIHWREENIRAVIPPFYSSAFVHYGKCVNWLFHTFSLSLVW